MKEKDFYIGQRLITPIYHKEEWSNCFDYVIVMTINKKTKVVYYKLSLDKNKPESETRLCSGMFFHEAEEYLGNIM